MNNTYGSVHFKDRFVRQFLRVGKMYWWFLPILKWEMFMDLLENKGSENLHGFNVFV